ncbi:DUF983 domain-containing protein [Mucilaginibacter sp. CSA2-8R]|uniref:DUF983 domain-containing protein n=1 Tax=Mucilaginibacter sp. CSA2-8R TaxID=3141542 RepID=UPI00315C85ED
MQSTEESNGLSLIPSLMACKCPRCRVGKVYEHGPYSLVARAMLSSCSHCGLVYEKEPGYFYAAMYVDYAFIVAELVSMAVAVSVLSGSENPWLYISVMLLFVLVMSPFNYRYSRMLLMYFLTPGLRYHPEMS